MTQLEAAAPADVRPSEGRGPAISARDLKKRYGSTVAVDGLSLEIRAGECLGLLGPNGAGKTTTIEILEGLKTPDSGTVEVLGMTWARDEARIRPRLGIQLQEARVTGKQRVQEVIALFRSFFPTGPTVDALIDRVQLTDKRKSYVRDLSGGQKQRLSVACALAGDPDILFLDEPTTGLDPQSRRSVWDICQRFQAGGGTIVITTHFMDEAERLCDRVAVMDHGRILVDGAPKTLIDELAGEHTIEFETNVHLSTARLESLPSVQRVVARGPRIFVTVHETHRTIHALMDLLAEEGGELNSLGTHRATLDDVFLALTGRQLRDE